MKSNKIKLIMGILTIFLLGALSGGFSVKYVMDSKMKRRHGGDFFNKRKTLLMEIMKADLELNPGQESEIGQVLDKSFGKLRDLRRQHKPEVDGIIEEGRLAIANNLDDVQKKKFEKMYQEFLERRNRHESGKSN